MSVFLIILTISIITAFAQILSSFSDIKDPDPNKKGISKVTPAGWFFYACTIILVVLPAIQKLLQDDIDEKREIINAEAQEKRDLRLRVSYDSSLLAMKSKFDTTTAIVSETLGKYGYKLDSSNKMLVSIRDSVKINVVNDPILAISADPDHPGIQLIEKNLSEYKLLINLISLDAGSAYFNNIKCSFALADSSRVRFIPNISRILLEPDRRLAKYSTDISIHAIPAIDRFFQVFIWIRGSYKRTDGTGNFNISDVYAFNFKTEKVNIIKGYTRQEVISLIQRNEK